MSRPGDADFLGRWSARKLKARSEPEMETAPEPEAPAEPVQPDPPAKTDEEILQELGLPDPDSLKKGDNFSAFMRTGVPLRLRNRALRRLWLSDPVLANLDGLNDYEQDFTDAATVVKDLKTAYRIGRGFLRDEPAEVAAAEPGPPGADAPATPEPAVAEAQEGPPDGTADAQAVAGEPGGAAGAAVSEAGGRASAAEPPFGQASGEAQREQAPSRPQRMRFRFDAG